MTLIELVWIQLLVVATVCIVIHGWLGVLIVVAALALIAFAVPLCSWQERRARERALPRARVVSSSARGSASSRACAS